MTRVTASPLLIVLLAVGLLLGPAARRAHAQELRFRTLETEDLRLVYYDQEHAYVVPYLARCYENSMGFYRHFFNYTPSEPVTILLQDFDDYGYAGTSTIPNNYITLGIEPFEYVYETCPTNERFNWVTMHELVHVVASEKATGADNFWRSVFFGKVAAQPQDPETILYTYLTSPRRYAPRWYHEGIAVFMETWLAGGIGRALGGYDEMVFRSMVRDSAYFYDVVGLESEGTAADFQIGQNAYLYGTRFMSYLAYRFGPKRVIAWVNRTPGSAAYYSKQFRQVFGTSLDDEWSRWIAFEHEWQHTNLDSIRQYPVTPERRACERPLGSASREYYDSASGKLYAAVDYPGDFAHIVAIDVATGKIRKICSVQTPALYYVTSLAYDPDHRTLFYTSNNGRHWRDLNSVDVRTGKTRRLINNDRIGDLSFDRADGSLWGVQHHNGFSTIVRIAAPHDSWNCIRSMYELPFGSDAFDLDVSPDGEWLTCSMFEITGSARLVRFRISDLVAGGAGFDVLYQFTNTAPANFVFSPDGRYLYGTAYQTGVSNVFRYDFERKTMDCMSNCETGYFRPIPYGADSLIVYSYTGQGLQPVVIPATRLEDVAAVHYLGNAVVTAHPVVKQWKLGSPRKIDIDAMTRYRGDYSRLRHTELASAYPVTEAYKNRASFGARMNFMDPVGLYGADLTATFTPTSELPADEVAHLRFALRSYPWTFNAAWNPADFYDYFGPTKTSRKGYSVSLKRHDYLIADTPRYLEYTLSVAHYGGLERLPDYQNVAASFSDLSSVRASLDFKATRHTIGHVDEEQGIRSGVEVTGDYVNQDFYPKLRAHLDVGSLTGWDHLSLWLRSAVGYSFGKSGNSFADFYFGGFGNNWVDHQDVKRYRQYESYPGVELNEVSGINFGKSMLEFELPPVRFRRFGFPALYCTWARPALFTTGLVTNFTHRTQRELINVGGQVDFRLVIFSGLSSTFSVGYAGAFEDGRVPVRELMVSLKIL